MSRLNVVLFGKLSVRCNEQPLTDLSGSKVQELFCYLLLHRDRLHARETLAGLLWGDIPTVQSKKYLRQALWQLQVALNGGGALLVEPDWVGVNAEADLWLDVAVFERAYSLSLEITCAQMDAAGASALRSAIDLYQSDLLEGWYQDWCLRERERLQDMCLGMLDKLMDYAIAHHDFENGMVYGGQILRYDRAREGTHQRLMRLQYLAGDRAGALRQYQRCVAALDEELDVQPAADTVALYQDIRLGRLGCTPVASVGVDAASGHLGDVLSRLQQLEVSLDHLQQQVRDNIGAVGRLLSSQQRQLPHQVSNVTPAARGRRASGS